jgi:hypothetical protein
MEIVFGWLIVALLLVLYRVTMGSEFVWLMASLLAWAEGRELFGDAIFSKMIFVTIVVITIPLYGLSFVRFVRRIYHRYRSPLLIGQRASDRAASSR